MSSAPTVEAPGVSATQPKLNEAAWVPTGTPRIVVLPNRCVAQSVYGRGASTSAAEFVYLSCLRSSAGGVKRSWPFDHDNVH
jgi:hypothetical protein